MENTENIEREIDEFMNFVQFEAAFFWICV